MQIDFGKKDYEDEDFKAAVVHSLPEPYHAEKILLKDKYRSMHIQDIITLLRNRFKELRKRLLQEKTISRALSAGTVASMATSERTARTKMMENPM